MRRRRYERKPLVPKGSPAPERLRRTKLPFRAVINGRPCTVSRFVGVYLFDYDN